MSDTIIAIDFDGTCVDHAYPLVGRDAPGAVGALRDLAGTPGVKLILWTMRDGEELQDAINWFADKNIPLYGANKNPDQVSWTTSPKAYAHIYIDDAAFGAPLFHYAGFNRPCIDWTIVNAELVEKGKT